MRLLSFLVLLAALALPEAAGQASPADSVRFTGLALYPETGQLYRFEGTTEGLVTIDDLGVPETPPSPFGGIPELPEDPLARLTIPAPTLGMISEQVGEQFQPREPVNMRGFSYDENQFRLRFDQGVPVWAAVLGALALLGAGGGAVAWRARRREKARLRDEAEARQRALSAREAERARLAREIHDGPLQDVHALRLLSGEDLPGLIGDEAGRIARELRAIAEGLRPPALGRFGLAAALAAHASRVRERNPDLDLDLDLDEDRPDDLPDLLRSALFRLAQESIGNAIEHGHAGAVSVRLRLPSGDGSALTLDVADDGRGLPWTQAPDLAALADAGHFGLIGMYERASAVGGTLAFQPAGPDGRGLTVAFRLPASAPVLRQPAARVPLDRSTRRHLSA